MVTRPLLMEEAAPDDLKTAVERMHDCKALLVQSVPVKEAFGGNTVWEGVVHVFELIGHPRETKRMLGHPR